MKLRAHIRFLLPTPGYEEDVDKVSSIFTVPLHYHCHVHPFSLGPHLSTHSQFSGCGLTPSCSRDVSEVREGASEHRGYLLIS